MPDATVSIVVTLPAASLVVGQTTQAVARIATDVPDGGLDAQSISWSSATPAVATVSATGLVRGVGPGTAQIRASIGTVQGTFAVSVTPPAIPVVAITLAQSAAILAFAVGTTFLLRDTSVPPKEFTVRKDV